MLKLKFLDSWNVKRKLVFLSGMAIIITVVLGVFSIFEFNVVNKNAQKLVNAYLPEWKLAENTEQWC